MVEGGRYETRSDMAQTAITIGRHVVVVLAHGDVAVVTLHAVVHRTAVIEQGACKCCRVMAGGTILRRRDMQ